MMAELQMHAVTFALVLVRVTVFLFALPVFGRGVMPTRIRLGLAVACAILLFSLTPVPQWAEEASVFAFGVLAACEIIYGAAIGFSVSFLLYAVTFAARMVERQMGMAIASMVDPSTGIQIGPLSQLYERLAILVLFAVNGHHVLLLLIKHSYSLFPVGSAPALDVLVAGALRSAAAAFELGLASAAPVLVLLFALSAVLAILARAVPEINMLLLSMPLRLGLGLGAAALFLPNVSILTEDLVQYLVQFCPL